MAALVIQTFPDNSLHRLNPEENSMSLELSPYMLHSNLAVNVKQKYSALRTTVVWGFKVAEHGFNVW